MVDRIEILGASRSLDEIIEGIIVLRDVAERNRFAYREAWAGFLPENGQAQDADQGQGRMAYNPVVSMRKCVPQNYTFNGKVRDIPYFVFILNQGRDNRPKSADNPDAKKSHCKLCENILGRNMIISEIDGFYLTPNGYPYHRGASLLINKGTSVKQGELRAEDIATWMKASILLKQTIFYNAPDAGASILEHQHAQVVDPEEVFVDNEIFPCPIFNPSFTERQSVNGREDVYRLLRYPIDALIFSGRDAPYKAEYAAHALKSEGRSFNVLVNKNEVYVIGRNRENETSICIRRKVGGYEVSGIGLLGDIEEVIGDLKFKQEGARIFSNMTYEVFKKNIKRASVDLDSLAKHF